MKKYFLLIILLELILLSSCEENKAIDSTLDKIKSGIIYMKSTKPIMGSDVTRTIYFDDYGKKKRTETVTSMKAGNQTVSSSQVSIDAEGYNYNYDPEKKFGYRSTINHSFNPTQINFSELDEYTMQEFGIKNEGTETIVGKNCNVYTIAYEPMNFKGRYAIWNNIPLREQSATSDFGYEYLTEKLVENIELESTLFIVPDSISITDMSASEIMGKSENTQSQIPK